MSLAGAAQALGIPEALVQRSAAARAQETGMSVDEILAAWAGGEVVDSAPAPKPDEPEKPPAEETAQEETAPAEPAAETAPPVIVEDDQALEPVVAAASRVTPAEVTAAEAAFLPEVVTVPTAGIRERTNFTLPRWLFGLMLIIPAFALFTLGGSATGVCGDATELETDVVTGEIVNCDGSEFTGSGIGGGSTDFIALGEAVYNGSAVGGVNCSGCHGANGGGGSGPALNGVLTTFGRCADHEEWVRLGSNGFQAAGETTYGDTNKPVGGAGIMPAHASLTDEQLASVSAFERVRFGGGSPDVVLADCGLTEDEEAGDGSGTTVPGEEGSGTTVPGEEGSGTTVPGEDGSGTTVG
jgi:mono/diheme cytochrome c family protein